MHGALIFEKHIYNIMFTNTFSIILCVYKTT